MSYKIKDIAAALRISTSTVSLVLNNKPGISESTRERVFGMMREKGYQNYKLSANKQESIIFAVCKKHGSVVSDTPFFSKLIEGMEMRSRQHGYNTVFIHLDLSEKSSELLHQVAVKGGQGLLVLATELFEADLDILSSIGLPFVVLDSYFDSMNFDTVVINNMQGSYTATKHLASCGHKQLGYIASSVKINNFAERRDGFLRAVYVRGLPINNEYLFEVDPTMEGAYRDMMRHLSRYPDKKSFWATAFFCDNDIIASACMKAFKEHGYSIPEDISIIGFDDMPFCAITDPPLSTMMVPVRQMGALAVDRLCSKINGETDEIIKIEVATNLIERGSVRRIQ